MLVQFTVDDILADSPASYSQIQIGDRLRMVSSACEDSVSAAQSKQASRYRRRGKKREKVSCDAGNPASVATRQLQFLTHLVNTSAVASPTLTLLPFAMSSFHACLRTIQQVCAPAEEAFLLRLISAISGS